MELRDYQIEAKNAIFEEWEKGIQKTLLVLPTGCHAEGEKLLMADGTILAVENIKAGDHLLGMDGRVRRVLAVTSGTDRLYRIMPVKGKPFTVTGSHQLTLVRTNEKKNPLYPCQNKGGEIIDVAVNEWLGWSSYKKHLYKLLRCAFIWKFPDSEQTRLPVDPYFLGILLGDGNVKNSISVTTPDTEVVEEIHYQAKKYNMHLREEEAGKAMTYLFVSDDSSALGRNGSRLHRDLVQAGIRRKGAVDKHVPYAYKTADSSVRYEILAGLLDSDGSYNRTAPGYDFISKSETLAADVEFICRSLGIAAYMNPCIKKCGDAEGIYYRVSISGDCSAIPCRVKRKTASARMQKKDVLRTGFTVKEAGTGKYYGFTVDGDNRYLLDDFTITHNCGKTIVFAKVAEECVRRGERVLILAHRGELLEQASDKIAKATGLRCAVEKAEETCLGSWFRIAVGSVQTMMREQRLSRFEEGYFDTIIIDEAHHCLSDSYQKVLQHFPEAHVLGVTATPDRGDMRNLGQYFESLAYEYTLPKAIKSGYLVPIKALTLPLKLDITGVGVQAGDFKAGDIGTALDPYLDRIAEEMRKYCMDRKTVVFLPLVKTSQKFCQILNDSGFIAAEVNGNSADRAQILEEFERGNYNVLCNSMLLTEGWDCPDVDCIIVLRPTKVRSLYSQMVGRGTRLAPGKDSLLVLDFLWHTERHELCHPASLICQDEEVARKMTENISTAGCPVDIEEAEKTASADVVAQREESLAKQLAEMRMRKKKLVDPLQFEMSIQAEDLSGYVPAFGWEMGPPTDRQKKTLEKLGILPDVIENAGKAAKLLDRLDRRRTEGLTTPKQIRFLEGRGFRHVGTWDFDSAKNLIDRIAANGWRTPAGISPQEYRPNTGQTVI